MVFKFIVSFSLGTYFGIYLSQNYNVPKVDDPQELYNKIANFLEKHKKRKPDR